LGHGSRISIAKDEAMKRILFFAFLAVFSNTLHAQKHKNNQKTQYGIELSQFVTGSGFSSGTEAYITVIPDAKKQISLGVYYCSEYKKITGISVHHERTLIRIRHNKIPLVTPYAFYDLIYRKNTIPEVFQDKEKIGDLVTYTSMEHHLGAGVRFKLGDYFSLKTEAGYGVYLGSIKKPSSPNPVTGEISGGHGFGILAKIGICYVF
jgi:hypothetical protein